MCAGDPDRVERTIAMQLPPCLRLLTHMLTLPRTQCNPMQEEESEGEEPISGMED